MAAHRWRVASMAWFEAARDGCWRRLGRSWALNLEAQKVAKPDTHQPACDGSGRTAVPLIIDRLPYVRSTVLVPLLSLPARL